MATRKPELHAFLDGVRAGYEASRMDRETERCVRNVFALLDGAVGPAREGGHRLPACSSLPQALRTAASATPVLAEIAAAFEALEPSLTWKRRSGGPSASANFMDGHANAVVVGPGGMEDRDDAWVGVSLLAPHVRYPDHRHAPEEVYLALSPGEFRRADELWFEPGAGSSFFNKPGVVHAMRSGQAPLFAVWCLHPGEAACLRPNEAA